MALVNKRAGQREKIRAETRRYLELTSETTGIPVEELENMEPSEFVSRAKISGFIDTSRAPHRGGFLRHSKLRRFVTRKELDRDRAKAKKLLETLGI